MGLPWSHCTCLQSPGVKTVFSPQESQVQPLVWVLRSCMLHGHKKMYICKLSLCLQCALKKKKKKKKKKKNKKKKKKKKKKKNARLDAC